MATATKLLTAEEYFQCDPLDGPTDVVFNSYRKVTQGKPPESYLDVAPELSFEVMSPSDRWHDVLAKVAESLAAGVGVFCVLNSQTETVQIFQDNAQLQSGVPLQGEDAVEFAEQLSGFQCLAREFFE